MTTTPATPNAGNARPRGGRGRFRPSVATVERDARAAAYAAEGWTYDQIAAECGYADRGDAWRGVQRVLVATARTQGVEDLRAQQVAGMNALKKRMWEILNDPPPLVDRVGRVVRDEDGQAVPDVAQAINAASTIIRADDRLSRLRGLDAPKRTMAITADMVAERLVELRHQLGIPEGMDEAEFLQDVLSARRPMLQGAAEPAD